MAYEAKKKEKKKRIEVDRSISHANSMIATKPIEEAPKSRLASKFQKARSKTPKSSRTQSIRLQTEFHVPVGPEGEWRSHKVFIENYQVAVRERLAFGL